MLTAEDGQAALELIEAEPVDLALLDIMLPFVDGFELIEPLKARGTPVIYLSAKGDTKSKVHGLKLGAEDYLVKPFDMLELLVRVEKVLARQQPRAQELLLEDIRVDLEGRQVFKAGTAVTLKPMEFDLLCAFIRHPGVVLTRETLLRRVWGDEFFGETRTVDVHVARLRQKLGLEHRITTVYKVGYRLEESP
ncbi:MAG: response regulator transcription factor [Christensenellales bacterium]